MIWKFVIGLDWRNLTNCNHNFHGHGIGRRLLSFMTLLISKSSSPTSLNRIFQDLLGRSSDIKNLTPFFPEPPKERISFSPPFAGHPQTTNHLALLQLRGQGRFLWYPRGDPRRWLGAGLQSHRVGDEGSGGFG